MVGVQATKSIYIVSTNCIYMIAEIKKWGNSLAIRLTGKELREHGLKEGDKVKIRIEKVKPEDEIDLTNIPTFSETDNKVSERHDSYLYRGT